jgi:hypothetical protein
MPYLPIVLQKPNNAKSRDQMIPAALIARLREIFENNE